MNGALYSRAGSRAALLGLFAGLAFPSLASAHGAVPESITVAFERADDPYPLISTSFGVLVAKSQDDWAWICEDLTGQTYGTLFEALPDGTWLFGATLGLWRSEDHCDWETIPELDGAFISALHRDPEVEGRVWLTTTTSDADNGLWRSDDSGASWSLVVGPDALGAGVEVRGFVRQDDAWALVGWRDELPYVWWSEDLEVWTEIPVLDLPEDASVLPLGFDPDEPGALWLRYNGANADQLVHATTDGAFEVRLELEDNLLGFATGPATGQLEVGGRTAGLHRSDDGGQSWSVAEYPVEVGCIVDHEGRRYICANNWLDDGAVIVGEPGGDDWTPVVDFADVHGMAECASGTEAADVCEPLWEGTRSFAGLDQSDPEVEDTGSVTTKEEGCSCASGARGGAGMLTIIAMAAALGRRRRLGPLTLAIGVGVLPGCASKGPDAEPFVAFVSPEDEAIICGDPFEAEARVEGFELIEEVITDPDELPEGQGHTHFFLNGQYVYEGSTERVTFDEPVEDGAYQFKVELANANHAAVEPYVYDLIYVTVDSSICAGGAE